MSSGMIPATKVASTIWSKYVLFYGDIYPVKEFEIGDANKSEWLLKYCIENMWIWDTDSVDEEDYYFKFYDDNSCWHVLHVVRWEENYLDNRFYISKSDETQCSFFSETPRDWIV